MWQNGVSEGAKKKRVASSGLTKRLQGPRAKFMLYPYYTALAATTSATMYMMVRMVLGHKTWY
nr:hypothetical protein B0A51_11683 [Rachicladosporium sp. CCFEE 5018]